MPRFNEDKIFQAIDLSLNKREKEALNELLINIYGRRRQKYKNIDDFEECKKQLQTLLNYIYNLKPDSLELFKTFHANISELSDQSPPQDIHAVLKSTKHSLEYSLPAIIKHHSDINKTTFSHLIVNKCLQGACSNIEAALRHFKNNELSLFLNTVKSDFLMQLAGDFLEKNHWFGRPIGNQIHIVNTLYNFVNEDYGLASISDAFSGNLADLEPYNWLVYLTENFSVSAFLQHLSAHFQELPNEIINTAPAFDRLHNFFQLFNQETVRNVYLQLYDEEDDENYIPCLKPKDNFLFYYACLLADYLEQSGFIEELTITINDVTFLYNGEHFARVTTCDGVHKYHLLSDREIFSLMDEPRLAALKPWRQLSPQGLAQCLLSHPHDNLLFNSLLNNEDGLFNHLLTCPKLPDGIVMRFFNKLNDREKSRQLAVYVFSHPYNDLQPHVMEQMSKTIPHADIKALTEYAVYNDKENYFAYLIPPRAEKTELLRLAHLAASYGSIKIILHLKRVGFGLTTPDANGRTLAHIAAQKGHTNFIAKLCELQITLNIRDNNQETPAHIAVANQNLELLQLLINKSKIDLNAANNQGNNLAHIAAKIGNIEIIKILCRLRINLKARNKKGQLPAHIALKNNNIDLFELLANDIDLNATDNDGNNLAHIAAKIGNIDIIKILCQSGINLNAKNNQGQLPAHIALKNNNIDLFELLANDIDLNATDNDGNNLAHIAAKIGNIDIIKILCESGINLNARNNQGQLPAHIAVRNENIDFFELLTKDIDLNATDNDDNNLAHIAAESDNPKLIDKIFELELAFAAKNKDGDTPLHIAARQNNIEFINRFAKLILGCQAENTYSDTPSDIVAGQKTNDVIRKENYLNAQNNDGYTPAYAAGVSLNIEALVTLASLGANIKLKNNNHDTLVDVAKRDRNVELIAALIKLGCHFNIETLIDTATEDNDIDFIDSLNQSFIKNNEGMTLVHMAARQNNMRLLIKLVNLGMDLNTKDDYLCTPIDIVIDSRVIDFKAINFIREFNQLIMQTHYGNSLAHLAVQQKNISAITKLAALKADFNIKNNDGNTPLHLAVQQKDIPAITKLAALKADFNIQNNDGNTPLHLAVQEKNIPAITKLAALKADFNIRNNDGNTPLHLAVQQKDIDFIIQFNQLITKLSGDGTTIAHLSAKNGYIDIIKGLNELEKDIALNSQDYYGNTSLHYAVERNDTDMIDFLGKSGINLNSQNNCGNTPAHYAAKKGQVAIIAKLFELNACLTIPNKYGETPACIAAKGRQASIITKLIELKIPLEISNDESSLPADKQPYIKELFGKEYQHSFFSPPNSKITSASANLNDTTSSFNHP